jgi:hypothetical protein
LDLRMKAMVQSLLIILYWQGLSRPESLACVLLYLPSVIILLSPLDMPATSGPYQSRVIDVYRAAGGMRIGRGKRSSWRKPATIQLCPTQIPHDLAWDRTEAAAVGSRWLAVWAIARPRMLPSLMNWKGFERKRYSPNQAFDWGNWGKLQNPKTE